MKKLLRATRQAVELNKAKGFTLIELLVVIAIIAILASLAIPQYLKYQRKATVSSYAEPVARACMMDYAAWCIENPGQTPAGASIFNNCKSDVATAGGTVSITATVSVACLSDGAPGNGAQAIGKLPAISDYQAKCYTASNSIKCTVEAQ